MTVFLLESLKQTLHASLQSKNQDLRASAISQLQHFFDMVNETSTLDSEQKKESIDFIKPYKDLLRLNHGCPILESCAVACSHIKNNFPDQLSTMLLFSLHHALVHIKICVQEHRKPSRLDNANFMLFVKMTFHYIQSREKHIELISLHESIRSLNTLGMHALKQQQVISSFEDNIIAFPLIFKRSNEMLNQSEAYLEIGIDSDHTPIWKEPVKDERANQDMLIIMINSKSHHVEDIERTGIHETFITSFEMKERASRTLLHHTSHKASITFNENVKKRCDMLDISITGMQIRTEYREYLELSIEKIVTIEWEEGYRHYPSSAQIRWFQKQQQGEVKIGIQFILD